MTRTKAKISLERSLYAAYKIEHAGYDILSQSTISQLCFLYMDNIIRFFPYKAWATGVGIKDGRGLNNLLNQIGNNWEKLENQGLDNKLNS